MNKFLAKSNSNETVKEHSVKVKLSCLKIFDDIKGDLIKDEEEFFKDIIKKGSLLHDIGKLTEGFQNYLKGGKTSKKYFLHNEIGWVFLKKYSNVKEYKKIS